MSTTLIFAELLTCGALASFAIILALLGLGFDPSWFKGLSSETQAVAAVIGLAFVYAFGIIVDGIADLLFSFIEKKIDERRDKKPNDEDKNYRTLYKLKPEHSLISLSLARQSTDFFEKIMEYTRIRIRILRDFLFNVIFIFPLGIWAGSALGIPPFRWYVAWAIFWFVSGIAAYRSLQKLRKDWNRNLEVAWKI